MTRQRVQRFDSGPAADAVQRFDLARLSGKIEKTSQGFLRIPTNFTRSGVFEYMRADGTVIRELRPEDEVFKADSMLSLKDAPVTLDHPVEGGVQIMVTSDNVRELSIGHVGEGVTRRDALLSGTVTVTHAAEVKQIESRRLKDVSCGYSCSIEKTAGVDAKHGRYDQIQRNIQYNHVALGGYDWGRAGDEVGLRLDSNGAVQVGGFDDNARPDKIRVDAGRTLMETITINGVEFEVPKAAAQAFRADKAKADAELKGLKDGQTELQAKFDALEQTQTDTKKKLEEAEAPERYDSAVKARIELLSQARKVLGDKEEITGTTREIQEKVLKHDSKDLDLAEKEDLYVQARFDQFMASYVESSAAGNMAQVRADALAASQGTESRNDAASARQRMNEYNRKAAEQPLAVAKD